MALSVVFSCKKDPEIPYCELHPDDCVDVREVKDYFYFKIGSWWVYEEENSGVRDSVYVIETYSDTSSYYFTTTLKSSYDGYRYLYWPGGGATSDADDNIVKKSKRSTAITKAKSKPGELVSESTCFLFYPTPGLWTYSTFYWGAGNSSTGKLTVEEIHNTYIVNDLTYFDVVHNSDECTSSEDGQFTDNFYSKEAGLIRKELSDSNQVWNLVEYHISE
jgi:hypothetical protein